MTSETSTNSQSLQTQKADSKKQTVIAHFQITKKNSVQQYHPTEKFNSQI